MLPDEESENELEFDCKSNTERRHGNGRSIVNGIQFRALSRAGSGLTKVWNGREVMGASQMEYLVHPLHGLQLA